MGRDKSVLEITPINVKEQCKEKKGWRGQLGLLQTNFKDVVVLIYFLLSLLSMDQGLFLVYYSRKPTGTASHGN